MYVCIYSRSCTFSCECEVASVIDSLPFLIKINEYKLAIGTLPGDSDTPWVDKHKPRTAVSVDSHSLVVYTELEIISGHVLDSFSINTHVRRLFRVSIDDLPSNFVTVQIILWPDIDPFT